MESLIDWAAQYSAPILVLLCIAAAKIFVLSQTVIVCRTQRVKNGTPVRICVCRTGLR